MGPGNVKLDWALCRILQYPRGALGSCWEVLSGRTRCMLVTVAVEAEGAECHPGRFLARGLRPQGSAGGFAPIFRASRTRPPQSPVPPQDTPARRFRTGPRRGRRDVSWSGCPESIVPRGWTSGSKSFPQGDTRDPPPLPRCSSRGYLRAIGPLCASPSGACHQGTSATLLPRYGEGVGDRNARSLRLVPTGSVPMSVPSGVRSPSPDSW